MKDFSMNNENISTDTSSLHDPWGAGFGADNCGMKATFNATLNFLFCFFAQQSYFGLTVK